MFGVLPLQDGVVGVGRWGGMLGSEPKVYGSKHYLPGGPKVLSTAKLLPAQSLQIPDYYTMYRKDRYT